MPLAGLETVIPAREWPQTRALNRAATAMGCFSSDKLECQ